jgi:serine/threonine protein kinase/class 3 adenylate cyclase
MIGSMFGNYRIEEKLGEGGMGVVYLATDTNLDRKVALKTLLTHAADDEERISRFLREAKAASRLQHPAIVTLYQFGVEGQTQYMAMEFVEGKTLRKIIGSEPMGVNQLLEIAIQIADGLAVAHEKGVIHRDLKAENVMVTPRGQVKILDFGLAKLKEATVVSDDQETAFRTEFGMVVGTVSTMSPEQALGKEVEPRSDIFSLGVILYQMATGMLPFSGPTPQAILASILNQEPPPPGQLNPDMPPELDRLIQQCLQKNHVFRPTSAELVTRLKNILSSLSADKLVSSELRAATSSMAGMPSAVAPATPSSGKMAAAKIPSGSRIAMPAAASSATIPAVIPEGPENQGLARGMYAGAKTLRIAVQLLSLSVPLAFLAYFVISGGLIRPEVVQGTWFMKFIEAVVVPPLSVVERTFTFRLVMNTWNFMLLLLAVGAFVLRHLLVLPLEHLEHWAKTRVVWAQAAVPQTAAITASGRGSNERLALLREYAEAKKVLFQEKRPLAFLSLDVAGSTRLKQGEDPLVVEHAFVEYKKFVERILNANNCWKTAWTPDGVMAAFRNAPEAVNAAQEVLRGLPWFNDGVHKLRQKFAVRGGVHWGEVVVPDEKGLAEISDVVIDVAGHIQKGAAENTVWISREALSQMGQTPGFRAVEREVDNHAVFEWRADSAGAPTAASA